MVAPNGARRGKADHPALPITDAEIIETARKCQSAGADGIHLHIRDNDGRHLLDAARYRALLDQLTGEVPDMYLQVTSEAAGRYGGAEQREMMRLLKPDYVSVALREMVRQPEDWSEAREFYHWAFDEGVDVQHILYSPDDVEQFIIACDEELITGPSHLLIFVQGRYDQADDESAELEAYLAPLEQADNLTFDWMACAFGISETDKLVRAARLGGKLRVGFENSLWHADGNLARDNADRVTALISALKSHSGEEAQ